MVQAFPIIETPQQYAAMYLRSFPSRSDLERYVDLGRDGKVALVAASSKRPGKASALAPAREEARVAICARTEAHLRSAVEEIRGATCAEVLAVPADLSAAAGIRSVVAATVERFGGIDVLVNNSGGPAHGRLWDFTDDDWRQAFEVITLNFARFAREVVAHVRERLRAQHRAQSCPVGWRHAGDVAGLLQAAREGHRRQVVVRLRVQRQVSEGVAARLPEHRAAEVDNAVADGVGGAAEKCPCQSASHPRPSLTGIGTATTAKATTRYPGA